MGSATLKSRRGFLSLSVFGIAGAALLAACGAPAAPAATTAPAKPAAEPTKPAAAAAPTTAPAAAAPTTAPAAAATKPAGAEPTKPAASAATTVPSGTKAAVELRVHDWLQDPDDKTYGPWIKQIETANPNIKIVREWFPRADMHTKQLTLAATNQIGDIVRANVAPTIAELKIKNVVQALDPFIKSDTAWANADHKQFWPGNIATYTIQGQQWGYPIVGHPGCLHYYYNADQIEKAGGKLPPADPKTWKLADVIEMFKAGTIKSADGRVSAFGVQPCLGGEGAVAVLRSHGGNYYNEDGTKCMINTPESIAGLQYLYDLYNTHKVAIPYDPALNYQETFPSGRVSVWIGTALAGTIKNLVGTKFKWSVSPPPIGPTGKFETQVSSDGIAISKSTKNPEAAWIYIKNYVSKDFGIVRHVAGLGSPGSRYDVWTDAKFKEFQPLLSSIIYDNLINPEKAPPLRPWSYPANGRFNEADTTMNNILADVWLGKKQPKDAADEAFKAVQAVMDKPPT